MAAYGQDSSSKGEKRVLVVLDSTAYSL
jgi:hypothetical protein